jgi:uncharacterized protein YdeI (YjbR/CyaY-like superfamily)
MPGDRPPLEVALMSEKQPSRLKRARQPMPAFVRRALMQRGLVDAYETRPPYQQNDYLGWINRPKREETKRKRLAQMLKELERGDRYMNMRWGRRSE